MLLGEVWMFFSWTEFEPELVVVVVVMLITLLEGLLLTPGRVTNSFLFCWLFTIKDWCIFNKQQTHTQSRFASDVFDGVLGPPGLAWHTWRTCPCFSVVPEATHKVSRGPLKGCVLLKKPFKGSRQRHCWKEWKKFSLTRDHWFAADFFYKKEAEKIELVARPAPWRTGHRYRWLGTTTFGRSWNKKNTN